MNNNRVLLLEADDDLRYSRNRLLLREGYSVVEASSPEEAVRLANQENFDLLIIRVDSPGLINMFLAQFPPSLCILILADKNIADELIENADAGVYKYLFSPFTAARFKEAVFSLLNRSRLLKESMRTEILTDLGSLNHELAAGTGIDKFLDTILHIGSFTTSADYVSISAYEDNTGEPLIKSETGRFNPKWKKLVRNLNQLTEPLILHNDSHYGNGLVDLINETGVSSVLYSPLIVKGEKLGSIININKKGKNNFVDSDLSFVSILAWWAGMAIENTKISLDYYKEHLHADRLLDHISLAQENERKRVAIDIHDGVAQWLVGATYDIKLCSNLISEANYSEVGITLDKVKVVLQNSVKELRRAISNLPLPPLKEIGLIGVIMKLAEKLEEDEIECRVSIPDKLPRLTLPQEKTFYWFVQESLTNIRRHSNATHVDFKMEYENNDVMVSISDNGVGFDLDKVMQSKVTLEHIGLLGMKERAEYLNGYLDIDSEPGKGTSVNLSFSLAPQQIVTVART